MRRKEIFREVLGLALTAVTLFCFLSFLTFDPADIAELNCPVNDPVRNMGGRAGAEIAYNIFFVFGRIAGWSMVLLTGVWGVIILFRRELPDLPYKIAGGILFLAALSVVESLAGLGDSTSIPGGGITGAFLTRGILLANIGKMGTALLVIYIAVISFLLATDFVFYDAISESLSFVKHMNLRRLVGAVPFMPRLRVETGPSFDPEIERMLMEAEEQSEIGLVDDAASARRDRKGRHGRFMDILTLPAEAAAGCSRARAPFDPEADVMVEDGTETVETAAEPEEEESEEKPPADKGPAREKPAKAAAAKSAKKEKEEAEPEAAEEPETDDDAEADGGGEGDSDDYELPPMDILKPPEPEATRDVDLNEHRARKLEETLQCFHIDARVVGIIRGPTITQFELQLRPGTKVNSVVNLSNDLAISLKAESVRVVANIPGKGTIGIEVPNAEKGTVRIRDLMESGDFLEKTWKLPLLIGKDASGKAVVADLASMPHLLIAGSTGSGKSICINSLLASLLMTKTPSQVKMILIDPKRVEMTAYAGIPHLITPVVTNMKKAAVALDNLTSVMDERYAIFEKAGVRQISGFNRLKKKEVASKLEEAGVDPASVEFPMPYIIVVVDELADLMLVSSKEVENAIIRLAQKSRAVGIHLVLSTQRPSSDVITGLIKSNMPSRIAFRVTSGVESRVILDYMGAEKLLGKGDMLYQAPGSPNLIRCQGTLIEDEEIALLTDYLRGVARPSYSDHIVQVDDSSPEGLAEDDEFLIPAGDFILQTGRASTTLVQRQFNIGYTRASRLIDHLEKIGLVGKFQGSKAREIAWSVEEWEAFKAKAKK